LIPVIFSNTLTSGKVPEVNTIFLGFSALIDLKAIVEDKQISLIISLPL
jgi:hypothetical protein